MACCAHALRNEKKMNDSAFYHTHTSTTEWNYTTKRERERERETEDT